MNKDSFKPILYIVIATFMVRVVNFNFPVFTSNEARVASRGYTLSITGKDELGRLLPLLFNSSTDYQLPAVSYITALGERIFSKTDFGVRIPFIIFGVALIIITYKIAKFYSDKEIFWIISASILIFSPVLIFLSKIPNDSIVLTFLIVLLFYSLARDKLNMILVIAVIIFSLAVSKLAWFIVPPFVIFTLLFYQNNMSGKIKIALSVFSLIAVLVVAGLYLKVPQSERSLAENNFSIFSSSTIINGVNKMRGQGIESGWPDYAEKAFFNKTNFTTVGFMHWLSNLQPASYFGQLDKTGQLNFSQEGAFQKVLIVPFFWGLIYLVRKGRKKERLLLVFFVILTFPAIFVYPNFNQSAVVLTLPFAAFIIAFGFMQFKRVISLLIISILILEVILGLLYLEPEQENTNFLRSGWVKELTEDVYHWSNNYRTAVSDDIVEDIANFIEWYNPVDNPEAYSDVVYPYKFHRSSVGNIKIIGSDNVIYSCKYDYYDKIFASRRDKDKVKELNLNTVKTYKDSLNQDVAFLLEKGLCIE